MLTLKDFFEVTNYRVTEGSDYGWQCFGPNAYGLDSWNGEQDGHTVRVVFDTKHQTVYQAEAHDYKNRKSYRWTHPDCLADFLEEVKNRNCNDEAYDGVKFVDLETVTDFLEKAGAIVAGTAYDTRVQVPLTLDKEQIFELMQLAHEQDITLNQLVENLLKEFINEKVDLHDQYDV